MQSCWLNRKGSKISAGILLEKCQAGNEGVLSVYLIPATYCVNKYGMQP
jgi:hypothetical protein